MSSDNDNILRYLRISFPSPMENTFARFARPYPVSSELIRWSTRPNTIRFVITPLWMHVYETNRLLHRGIYISTRCSTYHLQHHIRNGSNPDQFFCWICPIYAAFKSGKSSRNKERKLKIYRKDVFEILSKV